MLLWQRFRCNPIFLRCSSGKMRSTRVKCFLLWRFMRVTNSEQKSHAIRLLSTGAPTLTSSWLVTCQFNIEIEWYVADDRRWLLGSNFWPVPKKIRPGLIGSHPAASVRSPRKRLETLSLFFCFFFFVCLFGFFLVVYLFLGGHEWRIWTRTHQHGHRDASGRIRTGIRRRPTVTGVDFGKLKRKCRPFSLGYEQWQSDSDSSLGQQ